MNRLLLVLLLIAPLCPALAESIQLERQRGTYMVPVRINEAVNLPFVLDTGATEVAIPTDVFLTLLRTGTVSKSDFVGTGRYTLADGSEQLSDRFILHEMRVGDHVIRNVIANVVPVKGDPLLGQSFLSKLPSWTIDNDRHALILHERPGDQPQSGAETASIPPQFSLAVPPPRPAPPGHGVTTLHRFDEYSVAEVYRGSPVMPDFGGRDRQFKDYRTRIRNGITEGANFAGRYKVIQIGCGTGCSFVLVADVSTGRVYSFPHGGEYDQGLELQYQISSNLIRAWWIPNLEDIRLVYRKISCLITVFSRPWVSPKVFRAHSAIVSVVCARALADPIIRFSGYVGNGECG
jgi:clan AA aspartic protease (TIGR02281 family)